MARILILEDEVDLCLTMSTRLNSAGFEVDTANDAISALVLAGQNKYDLIIADIVMPGMDGLSFLSVIRTKADTQKTPVLVMTCRDDKKTKDACKDLGVSAYLVKPYDHKDVLSKVKELIGKGVAASERP